MEQDTKIYEYFLNPGELIFSLKPIVVKTVLGSCVAVFIHDKYLHIGGVCHYLLPSAPPDLKSTKYGDVAIYTLLAKFRQHGSKREDLVATLAGGAFIIFDEREIFFIGDKNIDMALEILRKEGIKIKQMWTGGEHGKRVVYNTATNKIIVETLETITLADLYRADF